MNDFSATGDGFAFSDVTSRKKLVRRIVLAGRNRRRYLVEYNSRQIEQGRRLEKLNLWKWQKQARKRQVWFVAQETEAYGNRGLVPSASQRVGFGVPAVFAEGGTPDTFVADIYEHISFLGDP